MKKVTTAQKLLIVSIGLVAVSANAALPTEATAAFTAASTAISDAAAAAWVPIGAALAAGMVIKMVKRFMSKT